MTQDNHSPSRRLGGRAEIHQPGTLTIAGREFAGVIHNVGLLGAFFAAEEIPEAGERGTLTRDGGRAVEVRIVRQGAGPTGVGLVWDR